MGVQDALASATGDTVEFDAVPLVEEEPVEEAASPAAGSVLAALRTRASEVEGDTTTTLALPYFKGLLWGRYHAVPMGRIYRQRNGQVLNPLTDAAVAADILATACDELLIMEDDELTEPAPGELVRYDDSLVDLLHLEPSERNARSVMFSLYASSGRSEAMIIRHFQEFYAWLTGEDGVLEVAESVAGEYPAP